VDVDEGPGDRVGPARERECLGGLALPPDVLALQDRDPAQAPRISERLGQALGLPEILGDPLAGALRHERRAQVEAQVDRQGQRVGRLREVLEGDEGLLEAGPRLTVRRPAGRLDPRLPKTAHGLVPHLAVERVVGEPLDLLGQPVGMRDLSDLPPPLPGQPTARYTPGTVVRRALGDAASARVSLRGPETRLGPPSLS
jgi:hypothetical protein